MYNPILSICIPTYNRCDILQNTLGSITSQKLFLNTNHVEIIISDNCSTDNTELVVKNFVIKYPKKIKYYKNKKNIFDKNFQKAMFYGNGEFLKLHNDTLLMLPNSLEEILDFIKKNIKEKPFLFFIDGNKKNSGKFTICNSPDEFLKHVSYYCMWIGGFGLWKKDFEKVANFNRYSELQLTHVDVTFRVLNHKKKSVIYNPKFCNVSSVKNKGGYNTAEVFGKNYLFILKENLKNKIISKKIFRKEKKIVLRKHVNKFYFDHKKRYNFQKTGYFKFLLKDYWCNFYFYKYYFYNILKIALKFIENIFKIK